MGIVADEISIAASPRAGRLRPIPRLLDLDQAALKVCHEKEKGEQDQHGHDPGEPPAVQDDHLSARPAAHSMA